MNIFKKIFNFLNHNKIILACFFGFIAFTAITEWQMGRLPLGPDGKFGWWDGNIWGSENSQRVADVYSFTHFIHGILFYAFLWLIAKKLPVRFRFLLATLLESLWEILENSSFIINRYREVTISLGYVGDSILNSCSDIVMMALGFLFAYRARTWMSVAIILLLEIICLFWVRDNLTLNLVMLIHPSDALKAWQSAGH